ncbi:Fe-S-cluster-containing hydrogenase components 1 [Pyrobaculum oguniense TE7]|uniref:Fe-S-cluster-containing hydrogenase components 1 n=2 Tax=Pyrobaculum TaxID=2276 RepID=H6QAG7_PYROT|nr:Fe-S-cluster-containing hydrogenase components 1 [Pyrobaculum oguniense TE7]
MTRLAHLWDQSRCIACGACIAACNAANYGSATEENKTWRWLRSNIRRVEVLRGPRPMLLLVQCQHCENAPCVTVCPTGASYKDVDGLVKIKPELCIGCKYCMVACPYEARWLDERTGLPEKCMGDECLSRVSQGLLPICVEVCPAGARAFGDLDDPSSEISRRLARSRYVRLLENKGTEPKYFVVVGP